jgi:hypothetical protein
MPVGRDIGGLDLDRPDKLSDEEWQAFAAAQGAPLGYSDGLPSYRLFRDGGRPDLIKRQRTIMRTVSPGHDRAHDAAGAADDEHRLPVVLAFLHLYIVWGYQPGIRYTLELAVRSGYSRAELMDVVAVANLHTVARGLNELHELAMIESLPLRSPSSKAPLLPVGWSFDPRAFTCGLDFSTLETSASEVDLIEKWYLRVCGEAPPWVRLLGAENPPLLKQMRNRFEHALTALPNQFLPYVQLMLHLIGGNEDGIRESLLLARGLGMTRGQTLAAIMFTGATYGGTACISMAARAGGDALHDWETPSGLFRQPRPGS